MLLVFGINVIGIMSFFFYERQQRAAYLETRQSIETKLTLEQESQEQVSGWLQQTAGAARYIWESVCFISAPPLSIEPAGAAAAALIVFGQHEAPDD